MTLADARAAAGRASDVLRLWCTDPDDHGTVDEDSYGNALLASAACFMRSHPEQAYVFMGAGGGGKSSFIKALMDHLDRRAMTFAPELLTQPTAMSAENAMLNLSSHLVAVSDDFTPGPKWQDILNMLKTLLTGLLPFSARRRGEDSVEGLRPLAVHIFSSPPTTICPSATARPSSAASPSPCSAIRRATRGSLTSPGTAPSSGRS